MNKIVFSLMALAMLASCSSLPSWMGGADKEIKRLPGERVDALLVEKNMGADPSLATIPFKLPAVSSNDVWPQHTGNFTAASGNLALAGDVSNEQRTSVGEGNDFTYGIVPRPVIAAGKVFAMDAKGYVSAHTMDNIDNKIWISDALVNEKGDEVMGGGLAFADGKLYMVCGTGQVAVVEGETGALLWKRNLGVPLRSAPIVADGMAYVISIDSQTFALDGATGKTNWVHRGISEGAGLLNSVSPAFSKGMVIAPYASGELYAIKSQDGEELWRGSLAQTQKTSATSVFNGIAADPVVDDAVVFSVSSGGLFSVFNMLNGQPLWDKPLASINTPWVAGDYVFVITDDNQLFALLKYDGRVRWSTQLPRFKDAKRSLYPIVWRGPILANDKLIVTSSDGELRLIDAATGEATRTQDIADDITTTPIVAAGKIWMVGRDATLHVYQ